MNFCLAIAGKDYLTLKSLLLADKDLETAALMLCHMGKGEGHISLLGFEVLEIPVEAYLERCENYIMYSLKKILNPELVSKLDMNGFSLITLHSHPSGYERFSTIDDANDKLIFKSVYNFCDDDRLHGSAIIMPDGKIIARIVFEDGGFKPMDVRVVGDELKFMKSSISDDKEVEDDYGVRVRQAFGHGTYSLLRNLRVAVVGCSGTGSVTAELLARNCIGELILVDDDRVEKLNLNRIINSTMTDAETSEYKTRVLERAILSMGLGTKVSCYDGMTADSEVMAALKSCDVIFSCVDGAEGRYHLECLATAYLIPLFNMGVHLTPDGAGGLEHLTAVAMYSSPDNGGLLANRGYRLEDVQNEGWQRQNPEYHSRNVKAGYLSEIQEEEPAVITLNSLASNLSVNDFLARLHGFRYDSDNEYNIQRFDLVRGHYSNMEGEAEKASLIKACVGLGDKSRLLDYV